MCTIVTGRCLFFPFCNCLMSEINDKNKEIEKLRKAALSRGKNTFESELKDTISVSQ